MKYFSVLLCLFLCYELSTQDPMRPFHGRKRSKEFYAECQERSGLSIDELNEFEHSGEAKDKLFNGDGDLKKLGCYFACLNQNYGVMTGNTFIRQEITRDDMEEDNPKKAERRMRFMENLNACMDAAEESGGDECDVALVFQACFEKSRHPLPPLA